MSDEFQVVGTPSDHLREALEERPDERVQVLKQSFFMETMSHLQRLRQEAGLTQEDLAVRMNTQQPSIARWERSFTGQISLHNLIDYAIACEMMPTNITFIPLSQAQSQLDITLQLAGVVAPMVTNNSSSACLSINPLWRRTFGENLARPSELEAAEGCSIPKIISQAS